MAVFYLALTMLAGGMLPLQAAINARLAPVLGGPVWAAAFSGLVLTIVWRRFKSGARKQRAREVVVA
jgi:transporter family-2 protein